MTVKTAISLPDDLDSEFARLARKHGMTRSEFHRRGGLLLASQLRRADLTDQGRAALAVLGEVSGADRHLTAVADVILDDGEAW